MRLLLDSSGAELVCALADAEGIIIEERFPNGSLDARDIGHSAGRLLGELLVSDLDAIIVGTGPGSFIGTRVAISYANGLAAAGGAAVHGVNSLAAIAAVYGRGRTVVLRDARRGQAYWYGPAGTHEAGRLVDYTALPRELDALGIESVVLEETPNAYASKKPGLTLVDALPAAVTPMICPGVPAEGLRRMQALYPATPFAEPVYLRDWQ